MNVIKNISEVSEPYGISLTFKQRQYLDELLDREDKNLDTHLATIGIVNTKYEFAWQLLYIFCQNYCYENWNWHKKVSPQRKEPMYENRIISAFNAIDFHIIFVQLWWIEYSSPEILKTITKSNNKVMRILGDTIQFVHSKIANPQLTITGKAIIKNTQAKNIFNQ
jgi:hypothetical protein